MDSRPPRTHRPAPTSPLEAGSRGGALRRRVRALMIIGVVGPLTGVCAIVAIHAVAHLAPLAPRPDRQAEAAVAREGARALALLEDRPLASATIPPDAIPLVPEIPLPPPVEPGRGAADFGAVQPTAATRRMADWVVRRHDNARMPFVVLDKRAARLSVFRPDGALVEDTPVLLGSSHGDDTFPGIGDVPIAAVRPYQRTTAAGRFVTRPGLDADRTDVVWLDYDAALAMHRVIDKVKSERRLQRLASPNPAERRISWGCINIPVAFFDRNISPVFGKHPGVAYVLPERKTFAQVFEQPAAGRAPANAAAMAPRDVADR